MSRYGTEGRGGGQRRGYGAQSGWPSYDRDYRAGGGPQGTRGEGSGGARPAGREHAAPGREMTYWARDYGGRGTGGREMRSDEYGRRMRAGWQRGYDRPFMGGPASRGYGSDYQSNRASSPDENEYYNPGPTYGLRDSDFSRRGRTR